MAVDIDQRQDGCCPDEERLEGRKTVNGLTVVDLHRHRGLYRGVVLETGGATGIRQRVVFWQRGGKLSRNADHAYDLRRRER
ncbi:hypothetical protein [Novosphingobium sp.]|uniref:hypothetical protein n=1 Tax=Novosphingobium sp. TaxID=1874826 RepID=UPI002FDE210A